MYLGETQQSLFGVNLSYGSQSSKSEQTQTNTQSQGSQLQAGKDIGLMANRDVNLISATNPTLHGGGTQIFLPTS